MSFEIHKRPGADIFIWRDTGVMKSLNRSLVSKQHRCDLVELVS
jgi:hypothetical protein